MTLILATGDNHWCVGPRWAECLRVHEWIAEQVEERRPDLFLLGGDLFERRSTAEERAAVAQWITRVAEVCPIVGCRGNHDERLGVSLFGQLRTRHPVIFEEAAGMHVVAGVAVAAFAWPGRAMLSALLGDSATSETVATAGREALRNVFRGFASQLATHDGPRILLGHAHVVGARVGLHGQPLAPGAEVTVGLEDLALAQSDAVVLGHIHRASVDVSGDVPIAYTGSPFRNSFGEAEPKSILALLFGFDRDEGMPVTRFAIPTPATPMVLLDGAYNAERGALDCNPYDVEPGAEVRLRYQVAADHREAARGAATRLHDLLLRAHGARSVKIDEVVIATTRARAPEVAEARSTWAQIEAHWSSRADAPPEDRRDGLRAKLAQVEEAS